MFESSILTIFYIFSFCLVLKTSLVIVQVYSANLQFISCHLIFLGSVDVGGYLTGASFEKWILALAHFSDVFFWPVFHMSGLCIILYFISYYIIILYYSIGIHKKCNSNHYLLLFHNSGVVSQKSYPTPHWIRFLIFCRWVYDIPSRSDDLILAWSTSLQLC